jgi:hypothetical protein
MSQLNSFKQLLKAFIIGSSWLVFVMLFVGFFNYRGKLNPSNCMTNILGFDPFMTYAIIAPLYIGSMSVLAIMIKNRYDISTRKAFFLVGIVSALIVSIVITVCRVYNFSKQRLFEQYIRLQLYHFILYSGIIANLYIYID